MSIRSLLQRVEVTQEAPADVQPIKSLDKLAAAIRQCTNYRVTCEAELARIDEGRAEVVERLEEAQRLEAEAMNELKAMVKNVCGVRVDD